MAKFGMGLIPEKIGDVPVLGDSENWTDAVKYQNQIVDARNSQLEYKQNVAELHSKIRQACKELTRKDNNIKENMEILALERGRLGYLRDELARRAEELARRELAIREKNSGGSSDQFSKEVARVGVMAREKDKENAFLVEMDVRRRSSGKKDSPDVQVSAIEKEVVESSMRTRSPFLAEDQKIQPSSVRVLALASDQEIPPSSVGVLAPPVSLFSPTVLAPVALPSSILVKKLPQTDALVIEEAPRVEQFHEIQLSGMASPGGKIVPSQSLIGLLPSDEVDECIEGLWKEYSSVVDEVHSVSLMSLPNFLRLCTDADFGLTTAQQIELFLEAVRSSPYSYSLVRKESFLGLLMRVMGKSMRNADETEQAKNLFLVYLLPTLKRLQLQERQFSSKHPPLPFSSLVHR